MEGLKAPGTVKYHVKQFSVFSSCAKQFFALAKNCFPTDYAFFPSLCCSKSPRQYSSRSLTRRSWPFSVGL